MFPMPEKRIFPMKNLLHYGSWLITAGVEGSEPTNLVFCRYFERPTQFFYQSSKEWAQGGEGGPSARSGFGRLRESGDFVVSTICLLLLGHKWIAYFLCLEIRLVWAGRICIDVAVGLGMSQRPNSNPASSQIHLGKHTFISSSTLLADTAKYDLGIRIWPGPHWTFGL